MPGTFFGYRERLPVSKGAISFWMPPHILPEVALKYWHWDLMGPVPFWYENYAGLATDDYPDDFVLFSFMSRLVMGTIRDAPAYIILTYDGETEQPERLFDQGFARLEGARGFKIKNANPGIACNYQLMPMI